MTLGWIVAYEVTYWNLILVKDTLLVLVFFILPTL